MAASSVIPSADKALLAAQATAGPAGVDAYEAAKKELAAQQAAAVAKAQEEAQRRGSPTAAASLAGAGASGMYDARIASLTEAGGIAAAQGEMRNKRMVDYSGAVEQARGLIGDQAKLAVAPINAETDFRIRALERQGQNDVDKIEAQMRLDAARAAAAAAAAASRGGGGRGGGGGGGGGGGSKGSVNQSELRSQMTERSKPKMGNAIATAQQAMRQTGEQQRQAASYAGNSANYALREALERAGEVRSPFSTRPSIRAAEQARQAASYTGRSVQEYNASRRATPAGRAAGAEAIADTSDIYQMAANVANSQRRPVGARANPVQANPQARSISQTIAPLMFNDRVSMLTPSQIEGFAGSPDAALYSYLLPDANGNGAVRRIRGVAERLGGAPQYADQGSFKLGELIRDENGNVVGRDNPYDGEVDDLSRQAMKDAMMLSAFDMMDEGYDITDPEITAALDTDAEWKPGSTYADVVGRSEAKGDTAEQQDEVDAANERYLKDEARNTEIRTEEDADALAALDDADRQEFTQRTGLDPSRYNHFAPEQLAGMSIDVQNGIKLALNEGVRDRTSLEELLAAEADYDQANTIDRVITDMIAEALNV